MNHKFLFYKDNKFKLFSEKSINNLSLTDAFNLGMSSVEEQRRRLYLGSLARNTMYRNRNIIDELDRAINKLNQLYPTIKDNLVSLIFGKSFLN